jgi:hypothetical protein
MIPVSLPVTPIQLTWVKSRIKGRHELTANGPILGSLQRVGFWRPVTQAEFKGKTWSFQRCGARTVILEEPDARPVAQFKANWLGGGTLLFNDGESFQLTARGFWRPVWSWIDSQGIKLLEVVPHNKTVGITGVASSRAAVSGEWAEGSHSRVVFAHAWAQSKLPVLIMFSWHQILQTNDDAAAAAAISVAAAG